MVHLLKTDSNLTVLLTDKLVTMHPMVVGEVACGNIRNRTGFLREMDRLPCALIARHFEALQFIESKKLMGTGLGFVDVHLLVASVAVSLKL